MEESESSDSEAETSKPLGASAGKLGGGGLCNAFCPVNNYSVVLGCFPVFLS